MFYVFARLALMIYFSFNLINTYSVLFFVVRVGYG